MESDQLHSDWELGFCDDNSPIPGEPIVKEVLADHLSKVRFERTNDTPEDKITYGLSIGKIANTFIAESDADIVITLCDDDRLAPAYIQDLCTFFDKNPSVMYAWSKVYGVNPMTDGDVEKRQWPHTFNDYDGPVDPTGNLDGSQVAFRISCFKEHEIWYDELSIQAVNNLDYGLFDKLFQKLGPAEFTGLYSQYKSIHEGQLIWHKDRLSEYYKDRIQRGEEVNLL